MNAPLPIQMNPRQAVTLHLRCLLTQINHFRGHRIIFHLAGINREIIKALPFTSAARFVLARVESRLEPLTRQPR